MAVTNVRFAEEKRLWGRECGVCKKNFSVKDRYDYLTINNNRTPVKVMSYHASLCDCRFACIYRTGELVVHYAGHPVYEELKRQFERRER